MREHHRQVAAILGPIGPKLREWIATGSTELQAEVVQGYADTLAVLLVHLRREVTEVVPVMEKVIADQEWKAEAAAAMKEIPVTKLLPLLGMLLANSSPADRREFWQSMPPPVKVLWPLVGRGQYRKTYPRLFPGEPVPETL